MKLAFSRPTADAAEQTLLFTTFRQAGFDGLQLKWGQFARYLEEPAAFHRDWGVDRGVVSGLIAAGALDDAGVASLRRVLAFARAVGSERVVFCHAAPRRGVTPAELREFARILSALGRGARDEGVHLSLHHHYEQPVMHWEDFACFYEAVEEGAVGLTVDTAHLVKSGIQDIAGQIRQFAPVIDNVHLKDFASGEFRVLGEGEIDFAPVFGALREIGYDGWLCADEESGSDLREGMAASYRFLKDAVGGVAGRE